MIALYVGGTLTVSGSGTIESNGGAAGYTYDSYCAEEMGSYPGGSGGSVYIHANDLSLTDEAVRARGGLNYAKTDYFGGAGRIAVDVATGTIVPGTAFVPSPGSIGFH